MKQFVFALGLFAGVSGAHASFNFNLLNPDETLTNPLGGTVTFNGTVTASNDWKPSNFQFLTFPFLVNSNTGLTTGGFTASFLNYVSTANWGDDYTGSIFTINVASGTTPGVYNSLQNSNASSFVMVQGKNLSNGTFDDTENFSVTYNPVPEPATMAALGLGAAALLRRRRK